MKRYHGTDGSLLGSLPWTLAALTFSLLPHLPYLPAWITLAFTACAGGRWLIEQRRWRLPPAWQRVLLALACFAGVLAYYGSVSGVGPGSALLAVMAALKLLETRRRRDQFVLLFISIFLIMSTLLREQYLWSLPYLLAGLGLTMTAWLQMSASPGANIRQSIANSGRLLLYAAPLALALWVFFPRTATPFWSVPIDTGTASTGLDNRMSPGDISALSQSNAVAFRVHFSSPVPPPPERYWRGLVLRYFNGRSWTGWEPGPDRSAHRRIEVTGDPVRYQVTLEPTRQQWIFALDIPYEWSLDNTFMGPQQQLARAQPVDQRIVYDTVSYTRYRTDMQLPRAYRIRNLQLPDNGSNPRTRQLAKQLRRTAVNDSGVVEAALRRFRQQEYFYTLEPPALGRDSVDEFLFDTRRGFCEHYASAFAVLMRAAGIPARVVLGYQGGEMNPLGGYLIVRQSDAHAWTEIWLEDRGWVRVDPTAAVAPERIEAGMSGAMLGGAGESWGLSAPALWMHRLRLAWDAANAKWNEWILGYGPENQSRFMKWLGMDEPDWRKMMLTLLAVFILLLTGISILLARRYRPPRRDPAARLYRRFIRKAGLDQYCGETPLEYSRRLRAIRGMDGRRVAAITDDYLAVRYGRADAAALQRLETLVREFRRPATSS